MAPLPKKPGERVNRSAQSGRWRTLPAARPFKRPPLLPPRKPTWLKPTRSWWKTLWASPMAAVYLEADVAPLIRLAEMQEERARGKLSATGLIAMQQLEDRFGLNPKSRRALQWEIAQAEQARDSRGVSVPKLRVVNG
jgi:hypothetical protein